MQSTHLQALADALTHALAHHTLVKLVLSKPNTPQAPLRVQARAVHLKEQLYLMCVESHKTRDATHHVALDQVAAWLLGALTTFGQANVYTTTEEMQWMHSKKGKSALLRTPVQQPQAVVQTAHDREKQRFLSLDRAFLTELGITNAQHQLVPAMARKWKQINKFLEVLDGALAQSGLKTPTQVLKVADFGCGKGYLTFATHDYLCHSLGRAAQVLGVELRGDLVALCNAAAQRLNLQGLRFEEGDVRDAAPSGLDIMIALHACDTATDHAIHTGIAAGARIILCSPCCHKELRPQLLSPHPLRAVLKHGIHQAQEAEMITDSLRALMLEACGYDAQVFEFIALEHTAKNKMILAVKRTAPAPPDAAAAWAQVAQTKAFYGVREQCLERLLLHITLNRNRFHLS
jgi:SAM-dependent methyltransferase